MTALLYRGHVEHRRLHPTRHQLKYDLYVYALDLASLDRLDRHLPLFGYNRRRPVSLRDGDYLDGSDRPIRQKLLDRTALQFLVAERWQIKNQLIS